MTDERDPVSNALRSSVAMFCITMRTDLIAQHCLIGGDWGAENKRHAHHYVLELQLEGPELDQHGYLVDIVRVDAELAQIRARYADQLLNDLPEFAGLNPSIEHFARIVCQRLRGRLGGPNVAAIGVRLWENELASAAYREPLTRE